jgi:ABC-type molybdenum transport system ATPase subunit/photorepair protein PhrA
MRPGRRITRWSALALGIARCLLADPELLFLDEPMNELDPAGMLELRGLIRVPPALHNQSSQLPAAETNLRAESG